MAFNENINVGTFIAVGRPFITHHGRPLSERTEYGKFMAGLKFEESAGGAPAPIFSRTRKHLSV
jgi:hypothetical protein